MRLIDYLDRYQAKVATMASCRQSSNNSLVSEWLLSSDTTGPKPDVKQTDEAAILMPQPDDLQPSETMGITGSKDHVDQLEFV